MLIGQTLTVYLLWLLAGKTKSYFIFAVLGLLLCQQVTFVFLDYYLPLPPPPHSEREKETQAWKVRRYFYITVLAIILALVVVGVGHYMYLQMIHLR